ncbi:MAG: diadenylate cyclase CdaA [Bacilli bacterium]|nr:diadenylate cyclase CdaA [Bacilli bacterium]
MTIDSVWIIIRKIIDVSLVWFVFYYILKSIRNNVRMTMLIKGIGFILLLKLISDVFSLVTIGILLEYIIMWGPLALIIIFQPEIRNVLEQLGRSQLLGRHKVLTVDERERLVYETIQAIDYLRKTRIGALIIIERDVSLREYIEKSKKIYGDISSELLISIFFPKNPLHDGAVIIQGNKITSAGAVLPTSSDTKISRRLGTRHRAALGICEETDAIALVVSEETGRLSVAVKGELNYNLSLEDVRMLLMEELRPKQEIITDEILEEEDNDEETI